MNEQRLCVDCACDISMRHGRAKRCLKCSKEESAASNLRRQKCEVPGRQSAHNAVFKAVSRGLLPRPETLQCVDCGVRAANYDHRDYSKPLDVQPVCRSCNSRRGSALPKVIAQRAA